MNWLIAAYAAVILGVTLYGVRLRRLRRDFPPRRSQPRPPRA
jgi:hypothetical protein